MATNTGNPYARFDLYMRGVVTRPLTGAWRTNVNVSWALLSYTLFVAIVYLVLNSVSRRRKKLSLAPGWIVERPQGRYLVLNQYTLLPITSIVSTIVYFIYVGYLRKHYEHPEYSKPGFLYWSIFNSGPAFLHVFFTTIAVLTAANLASSRKNTPAYHPLPPWASNSLPLVVMPAVIILALVPTVIAGHAFAILDTTARGQQRQAAIDALSYPTASDALRTPDSIFAGLLASSQETLLPLIERMYRLWTTAIGCCLTTACLIMILNVTAGVLLLANIRRVDVGEQVGLAPHGGPIAAPSTPLPGSSSSPNTSVTGVESQMLKSAKPSKDKEGLPDSDLRPTLPAPPRRKVAKLDWSVTIFYAFVVPTCLIHMIFWIWLVAGRHQKTQRLPQHIVSFIPMFGKSAIDSTLLTILNVKLLLELIRGPATNDPASTLPRHTTSHHVQARGTLLSTNLRPKVSAETMQSWVPSRSKSQKEFKVRASGSDEASEGVAIGAADWSKDEEQGITRASSDGSYKETVQREA